MILPDWYGETPLKVAGRPGPRFKRSLTSWHISTNRDSEDLVVLLSPRCSVKELAG